MFEFLADFTDRQVIEIVLAILSIVALFTLWHFRDNRSQHREIYRRLDDHNSSVHGKISNLSEKVGRCLGIHDDD